MYEEHNTCVLDPNPDPGQKWGIFSSVSRKFRRNWPSVSTGSVFHEINFSTKKIETLPTRVDKILYFFQLSQPTHFAIGRRSDTRILIYKGSVQLDL
jgi:hypothetical protein